MPIEVTFWGTRGSIPRPQNQEAIHGLIRAVLNQANSADIETPSAINAFLQGGCRGELPTIYGGETSCVEIRELDGPSLLIDFGTGARAYSNQILQTSGPVSSVPYHVLMSHFHWDHMMGFPFFAPASIAGNVVNIYSCHPHVAEAFHNLHAAPGFPVPFDHLAAEINFHVIEPEVAHQINGFNVTPHALNHADIAYGFRVERDGRSIVYASDAEHKPEHVTDDYPFLDFIRDADLLIFDAQYSLAEATSVKEDWGHSSNVVGVELALMGDVRHLAFFHHEPLNNDQRLDQTVEEARRLEEIMRKDRRQVIVTGAYDGLKLVV